MINDHTHIFGCGVPTYEEAGRSAIFDTPEDVLIGLSSMNMNETVFLGKEPQEVRKLLLQLYDGRKTTYPVRAFVRMLHKYFGFEDQEVTLNSVYTRSGQNSTPNSNATNLHSSQKRCCSFCISSSNASPTFQVQKSIFHQMTKPIQVTVILPLLLAISFSRNDDIHSSISGISNDLIGVIPTIGQ